MGARELGNPLGNPLGIPLKNEQYGEAFFALPGNYIWTCPPGVTRVCAVAVGGGGPPYYANSTYYGGGGGALCWANDIPVTPGVSYKIVVGAGAITVTLGPWDGTLATASSGLGLYAGQGGRPDGGVYSFSGSSSKWGGGKGGNGSISTSGIHGGGGAGGYSGDGTDGISAGWTLAASGGAASGGSSYSGGGVGVWGEGSSGAATSGPGRGGSGGTDGMGSKSKSQNMTATFGGGGSLSGNYLPAGSGAFRIIWGNGRAFPSTNVGV